MSRVILDMLEQRLDAAFRTAGEVALMANLASVRPEEWHVRPLNAKVGDNPDSEFGSDPVLTICDLVLHVGGGKYMYADHCFNPDAMRWGRVEGWGDASPPSREMNDVLAWLEEGHAVFTAAVATLEDDAELAVERWHPSRRRRMRTDEVIETMIRHDLYHAGEIN
jgi:uncharacterized damage-inducible protein DinB